MTLDNSHVVNIYNNYKSGYDIKQVLLKTLSLIDAIEYMDVLVKDPSYIGICICNHVYLERGIKYKEYLEDVNAYELSGSEVAKLRTMREKVLMLLTYSEL